MSHQTQQDGSNPPPAKRYKTSVTSPTSFVTWNCNGFTSRCRWDVDKMKQLLVETQYPDFVFLQEARLKAKNAQDRGQPMASEYQGSVQEAMEGIFQDYRPIWSLADNKYSGTLTLIHKRLQGKPLLAFTTNGAVDRLLERLGKTRQEIEGLSTQQQSSMKGTKKQTSMKSFFAPKGNKTNTTTTHHPEGRLQFLCLEHMDILQTYVPNNGRKEESFQRRNEWDNMILRFLKDRNTVLQSQNVQERPLLWCGDLNVAHQYQDGTHWETKPDGTIYEWWRDEDKCIIGKKNNGPRSPENMGIPSFTIAERKRFQALLQVGDFVDVWRKLHPDGDASSTKLPKWERPNYTWRGHLAKGAYNAKYQGKGQRLDYFLLSPSQQISSVESCQILGYGENRDGHFCGSDHCAVLLRLKS